MLGFRPYQFYYYTWKYVSPICMAVLMTASIIQLGVSPPGYSAWIREEVSPAPSHGPAEHRAADSSVQPSSARSSFLSCWVTSQLCLFLLPLLGHIPALFIPPSSPVG